MDPRRAGRNRKPSPRRGGPVLALGLVLGGWVVLRGVLWENPLALYALPQPLAAAAQEVLPQPLLD